LPRARRKPLGLVLAESQGDRIYPLGFAGFYELAIPGDMEKTLSKSKKVMGGKI
jgi:hypothetical protein